MAKSKAQQAAIAISMKAAGKKPKKMAMGGMNDDKGKGKAKPTKETKDSKIMWEKTKKSLAARPGGAEMIRREQAARDSLMKAGLPVPGSMKKGGAVPKGYHRMPSGKIMKNSAHKTKKK